MTHEVLCIMPVSKYWFESLNFAMKVLTIGIQSKTYVEIGLFGKCRVKSSLKTLLDVGHQKNDASVWLFSWIIFVSRNESRPFLLCCLLFPLYCLLRKFLNFSTWFFSGKIVICLLPIATSNWFKIRGQFLNQLVLELPTKALANIGHVHIIPYSFPLS